MANELLLNEEATERAHKRKANMISFVFHVGLLLLAFFSTCEYEKAIDKQYAVALNFEEIIPPKLEEFVESSNSNKAQEKEGAPRKNADKVAEIKDQQTKTVETKRPEVKLPTPTPTPPTPTTDPVVSETTFEDDTEITAAEEEIEIDNPEPEPIPEPAPEPEVVEPTPEPVPEPAKESVQTKIGKILDVIKAGGSADQGNPEGDPSRSDGTDAGTGEGKTGTGAGRDESGNDGDSGSGTGGGGVGEYDGSGNGVFGRRVIKRNITEILSVGFENQEGRLITAKVCVNRGGNVIYAELLDLETDATIPRGKEKDVLKGFYGYKYEPDPKAPSEQCGKLKVRLQRINAFGQ
jgi:outer membrane biosynthesis protein TonB